MKTVLSIAMITLFLCAGTTQGQVLLAKWTFPTGTANDSLPDGGVPVNLSMSIHSEGGTSAIDFSKNGATTKAAQATGWNDGAMLKCWVVQVNTTGHEQLKLSSKQQSGGNNPGPRDYSVQYRLGATGDWMDVPNTTLVTANNWTSAWLDSIPLPEACDNQESVYIRWLQKTNIDHTGGTVISGGINKIDDIYITGKLISTGIPKANATSELAVFPNPSDGRFTISGKDMIRKVEMYNLHGELVYSFHEDDLSNLVLSTGLKKGMYLIKITFGSGVKTFVRHQIDK